jgi:hypothetical protein
MSRIERQLLKLENMRSLAQEQDEEKRKKDYEIYVSLARPHATAVAAIVLAGNPNVHEPLVKAWKRALLHYKIDNQYNWNHVQAAKELFPLIVGDADMSHKFSEIFAAAPAWLLTFTTMVFDATALKFRLPQKVQGNLKWGRKGYEESLKWPSLPSGRMTDGDPVTEVSPSWRRSSSPAPSAHRKRLRGPLEGAGSPQVVEPDPEPEENNPELIDDIILLFEVEENPEKEEDLSRYEKIRLSNLRNLRPSGKVSPNLSRWESKGIC